MQPFTLNRIAFQLDNEAPIGKQYHYLNKTKVAFDIEAFEQHLQTYEGGNKDPSPAKATAAHVKAFFRFTPETTPPYKALMCFQSLQHYFAHLKTTMKFSPTTIQEKLRAIRQAINYVAYLHDGNYQLISRFQTVRDWLKI